MFVLVAARVVAVGNKKINPALACMSLRDVIEVPYGNDAKTSEVP